MVRCPLQILKLNYNYIMIRSESAGRDITKLKLIGIEGQRFACFICPQAAVVVTSKNLGEEKNLK